MKTVLCVPGHDEKKVANCRKYGADLILFDLEDSVPENMKERAREIVAANVTRVDAVRINTGVTGYFDVVALRSVELDSVWVPKMETWTDGAHSDHLKVVIIETPRMLATLQRTYEHTEVLGLRYVFGLAFGAADFAAYMNVPASSPQVAYARQQVALAAAALGVEAYDSPCTKVRLRYDHPDSVYNETFRAQTLGYQWKGVVHPLQIEEVKAVSWASKRDDRELVKEYERQSEAVMLIGNELVAPPMVRAAKKRLEDNKR